MDLGPLLTSNLFIFASSVYISTTTTTTSISIRPRASLSCQTVWDKTGGSSCRMAGSYTSHCDGSVPRNGPHRVLLRTISWWNYCERSELLIYAANVSEHRPRRNGVEVDYNSFWRATASSVHTCFKESLQIMDWVAPRFGQSVTLGGTCAGAGSHLST